LFGNIFLACIVTVIAIVGFVSVLIMLWVSLVGI